MTENENENNNNSTENIEIIEIIENIETDEIVEPEHSQIPELPELIEILPPSNLPDQPHIKKSFGRFKESIFGITAILGIITLVTALVLALVNSLTAPVIAQRLADEKQKSIAVLFGDGKDFEIVTGFEDIYSNFAAPVTEVAVVKDKSSQKIAGYCVTVTPQGFSGQIIMLVAVSSDISVKGTKILDMNETAGLGTKIESEEWFGGQFKHKRKDIKDSVANPDSDENAVKIIAGATKSSKAFLNGVNAALEIAEEISRQMKISGTPETQGTTEEIFAGFETDEIHETESIESTEQTEQTE